ncbi:MAG: nucleotidyltransferase domain-containing protein [Candidatus Omnitrophica bacterium]|nr:nucleotidyltransferase domain-containing protein [Candidatus Omnitrophota bacterium]
MISLKSQVTRRLLNYFFINPQKTLYVNEISKMFQLDKRNLVKKIRELEEIGLLKSEKRGNLKLYSINRTYPLYDEYRKIVMKTLGPEGKLRKILQNTIGATEAYIYGSYAKDKMDAHSDIDLLIVGSHDIVLLQKELSKLQKAIDREINTVNMNEREFKKRIARKDSFIIGVLKQKTIRII